MTAPLTFRVAEAADVDSLLALVHSAYRGPSGREGWTSEADLIDGAWLVLRRGKKRFAGVEIG